MARPPWQDSGDDPTPRTTVQFNLPRFTPAVKWLMIVNGAVFLASFLTFIVGRMIDSSPSGGFGLPPLYRAIFGHLELAPYDWRSFFFGLPVWQLATYGFLHDPLNVMHVIGNMITLYFFGTMLESLIGTRRFLLTYFSAMFAGALLYLAFAVAFGDSFSGPVVGASGACLGVMIAAATLRPYATVLFLFVPLTLRTLALIFVALDVFGFLVDLSQPSSGGGVAHLVHLGGILYGFAAVRTGWIAHDPVEALERRRAVAHVERAASDEVRMDQILEKIHREGMSALTRGEKDFLKRMSAKR